MLKRGLLFLLVFFIFLENGLAQDSCLVASDENVPQYAQNLLQAYSGIDSLEITPQQAVLDSLDKWNDDEGSGWLDFKESIKDEIRETTEPDIEELINSLSKDNPLEIRLQAYSNLVRETEYINDDRVIRAFIDIVRRDTDSDFRGTAIVALSYIESSRISRDLLNEIEDVLNEAMKNDINENKLGAADSLIFLDTERGLNYIVDQIKNRNQPPDIRESLTAILGNIIRDRDYNIVISRLIELTRLEPSDTTSFFTRNYRAGKTAEDWPNVMDIRIMAINALESIMFNLEIRSADSTSDDETFGSNELIDYIIISLFENLRYATYEEEGILLSVLVKHIDFAQRASVSIEELNNFISQNYPDIPSLNPPIISNALRSTDPLFKKIYDNVESKELHFYEVNSISIAVYRYLLDKYGENPTEPQIDSAIEFIKEKRNLFRNKIILGPDTYLIHFTHSEERFSNEDMEKFARARGVTNIADSNLKGPTSKSQIINLIESSSGPTTIWFNGHGGREVIGLAQPGEYVENTESGFDVISHEELSDSLYSRGNLEEVILIIDACFSYDFAELVLSDLQYSGISYLPTIITETNKGQYGYGGIFLNSLNRLGLDEDVTLLGNDIYKAEKYSLLHQDSAVFFSEGNNYNEIALRGINHEGCGVCEEGSCLIEPSQGLTS